jgi:hypothetical protein
MVNEMMINLLSRSYKTELWLWRSMNKYLSDYLTITLMGANQA